MENHIDENITVEINAQEFCLSYVKRAIDFLSCCIKCEKSDFILHCIISEQYKEDVAKYHGSDEGKNNANATYIPPFYQRVPNEKPIVIVNWNKIKSISTLTLTPAAFAISVFVHEFVHYLDYRLCPEIEKRYGKIFSLDCKSNTLEDRIGGLFSMRSEMRAKYFQEKYLCTYRRSEFSPTDILTDRIKNYATEIVSEDDFYNIAHLTGQIRCWKELSQNDSDIVRKIKPLEKRLEEYINKNPACAFNCIFEEESFLKLCDKTAREMAGNRCEY